MQEENLISFVPDDAFAFSDSATTISHPVLSAHISNWSLAAALNVSPAAINIWKIFKNENRRQTQNLYPKMWSINMWQKEICYNHRYYRRQTQEQQNPSIPFNLETKNWL